MKVLKVKVQFPGGRSMRVFRAKVHVTDDWYPTDSDGTVEMSFYPKEGRICLWGDDDYGLEKNDGTKEEFDKILKMDGKVNIPLLKKMGFVEAG